MVEVAKDDSRIQKSKKCTVHDGGIKMLNPKSELDEIKNMTGRYFIIKNSVEEFSRYFIYFSETRYI